jgi:hypothetical protein
MKKKMKIHTVILILLLTEMHICAQDPGIVVYEPFTVSDSIRQNEIAATRNILKWNLGLIGRGCFAIDYERVLGNSFTIELEGGITYRDFIFELLVLESDPEVMLFGENIKASFMAGVGLRYYPNSDYEGFYFSPVIRYRNYYSDSEYDANGSPEKYNTSYNMTDIGFIIGGQEDWGWSDILTDFSFGISLRHFNYYENTEIYDNQSYQFLGYDSKLVSKNLPAVIFGYKIGFTL